MRLPRNNRNHFQEDQLGLCNSRHCKPGMAPELGESRVVQTQKQCAGKWRSRMNEFGLDREGYIRSQAHGKYGQSVRIYLAQPCTWSCTILESCPVLSSCIFLYIFSSVLVCNLTLCPTCVCRVNTAYRWDLLVKKFKRGLEPQVSQREGHAIT